METSASNPVASSHFLQLPRELRNQIYDHLLGPNSIAIECAVTKAPRSLVAVGGEIGFCEALYQKYKLTYPLAHRSTWEVPIKNLDIPADDFQLDSSAVSMTYQVCPSLRKSNDVALELQLFEVCQQIHAEVSSVFYVKRTLSFPCSFAIPTAAAFLADRSIIALSYISSLQLSLFEVRGSELRDGDYSGSQERARLRDACGYYHKLCSLLASRWINLRTLCLSIESYDAHFLGDSLQTLELLNSKDSDPVKTSWSQLRQVSIASWVDPLLNVRGLETLEIDWQMSAPGLQEVLDTVGTMRRRMIKGGEQLINARELHFRHVICSESFPEPIVQSVQYNPGAGTMRWRDDIGE